VSSTRFWNVYHASEPYRTSSSAVAGRRLRHTGMVILVLILVVTGSYIRTRPLEESDTLDWLVLVQLGTCMAGGFVGALLISRHSSFGSGARRLIFYLLAAIASSAFSSYLYQVVGYWFLLAGTSLLCIGLVSSSPTETSLRNLEKLILVTLSLILVKDTILDAFFLEPGDQDAFRLGERAANANSFGLMAAVAFCMSLGASAENTSRRFVLYAFRGLFGLVILLTRSRVALIALIFGCLIRLWFSRRQSPELRSYVLLAAMPCCIASLLVLGAMSWTVELPGVTALVDFLNRGEDSAEVMSVTGRTEIWPYAIERISDGTASVIFGHGYGVSKETLNENNWRASFIAYHSHNTFLELMLAMGVLGTLSFLLLISYSLKWFTRFFELCRSHSSEFTLRAIAVMTAILSSTMTESDLATKIGPVMIVFMFYLLALDRAVPALYEGVKRAPSLRFLAAQRRKSVAPGASPG
jgi:O-antigen ligase